MKDFLLRLLKHISMQSVFLIAIAVAFGLLVNFVVGLKILGVAALSLLIYLLGQQAWQFLTKTGDYKVVN